MFGYVKPLKDDLKVHQYTAFKSYYCGLCHHIKKDFGHLPRLVLNYDLTTLAVLLDGLSPNKTYRTHSGCITNPIKKKPIIVSNDALSYAGAMNVSLAYYKLLDDVKDEKSVKSQALATLLSPYSNKFSQPVQEINKVIHTQLQKLEVLETTKNFHSIDEISDSSALIVANILKMYPHPYHEDSLALREDLFNFGYALGKWIYIIDALDDLKKDMETHAFNPINVLYNQDNLSYDELIKKVREPIGFTLLNCGATCKTMLYRLPLVRNKALLKNIVVLGMMDEYTKVISSCNCKGCKTKHTKGANSES